MFKSQVEMFGKYNDGKNRIKLYPYLLADE